MEKLKNLREKSGAGMVECKAALDEAGGDIEKALEILRKKGIAKASKRSDREASEGIIKAGVDADCTTGMIMEINSETDFVARSEKFRAFADEVFSFALETGTSDLDDLLKLKMKDGNSVSDNLDSLSGIIGEKLGIKRLGSVQAPTVSAYVHPGDRLAVIVGIDKEGEAELAREIAMQAAASNPVCAYPEQVPEDLVEKEKEIYAEQLKKEGKDEAMVSKIMPGKLKRFYSEVCLSEQEYIKDDKKKVSEILGGSKITRFERFSL